MPGGTAEHADALRRTYSARVPGVVVGAAILDGYRLLGAQRAEPAALAGGWELPGGKVEHGEREEDALVRECREELGIDIALGERISGEFRLPAGPTGSWVLRVWTARIVRGTPRALEDHLAVRWLEPDEWYDVAWLRADLPVIDAVRAHVGLQRRAG
jgi:8-oxo-dGTP diphosphatase